MTPQLGVVPEGGEEVERVRRHDPEQGVRPSGERLDVLQPARRGHDLQGNAEVPREVGDVLAEADGGAAGRPGHDGARVGGLCRGGGQEKEDEATENGGCHGRHDLSLQFPRKHSSFPLCCPRSRSQPGSRSGGPAARRLPYPRPHRRPAPCPEGQGPCRRPGPAAGSGDHRGRGREAAGRGALDPLPPSAPGAHRRPRGPEQLSLRHADQARAPVLLPDRLAAGQPLGPVRARPGPLRALRPAAWRDRAPPRRRPLVGRGAADLARRPGPGDPLACPGRAAAGADDQGGAGGGASRPRPRRIAAGGTAMSGRCASGATCCTTGPSIAAGSGSPCAGEGPWATCSRGPILRWPFLASIRYVSKPATQHADTALDTPAHSLFRLIPITTHNIGHIEELIDLKHVG